MPQEPDPFILSDADVNANAPAFIIYSPQPGERLNYVCRFIFNRVLKVNYRVITDLETFKNETGFKVNYSAQDLQQVVQIIPHSLLFETGISTWRPEPVFRNGMICFFGTETAKDHILPFDLFSAVFYFISRYEEWQAFEKDSHQRFEAGASLLFKHGAHLKPVVDHWILEFKSLAGRIYPKIVFPERRFRIVSTLDVDNLFAFRSKGWWRTLGACAKDLVKLEPGNLHRRLRVLSGKAPDPFDVYADVSDFCREQQIPLFCFFLFRSGTTYDRTVSPHSGAFKEVLATLEGNKAIAGLHPSYDAAYEPALLQEEVRDFSALLGEPVTLSRQHYLRFDIRTTPKLLLQQGIRVDFTMGFASSPGFRAGTSQPFFYYDFALEKSSELLFVPFCVMDGAYLVYDRQDAAAALDSMLQLAAGIRRVQGTFISVFHERTFSNHLYPGFGPLYKNLHLQLKNL